jgi:eukaryotic-like serine/threonine-protein kinase
MPETHFQLRAVLFADIVGFTTWMEQDFDFATGLVKQVRDVMGPMVVAHDGIVHRQFGDGFLLTFSSAVEAVRFALNLNKALPESDPPALRIGIEVGEVAVLDEDLQGTAANIGARLHALATPRTVVVSGNVQLSIKNQVEFDVVFRGTEHLKNTKEPIDTYTVRFKGGTYDRRYVTPFKLLHYDVLEKIGEGGMGEVYLAQDTRLNRPVAIKVLSEDLRGSPEMVSRLRAEAEAAAQLNHANIATTYAVEESEDLVFIVMEYIDGETLSDRIPRNGLDFNTFYEWYVPLAQGLSHAHSKGIIHRDIKPSNIMVSRDNIPKILDFGLATISSLPPFPSRIDDSTAEDQGSVNAGQVSHREYSGARLGRSTGSKSSKSDWAGWANMSPEQITDRGTDHRSDMYSFGVTMYRGLTGTQPFKADDEDSLVSSIIHDHPTPIQEIRPNTPRRLIKITDRTLAKDIGNRYESTEQFVQALSASRDRPWHRALGYAAAATVVLILLVGVVSNLNLLAGWSRDIFGWPPSPPLPRIAVYAIPNPDDGENSRLIQSLFQDVKSGLSGFEGLRVTSDIAVSTLLPRQDLPSDPAAIMRVLGVDYLLLGKAMRVGDRNHYEAELLDMDLAIVGESSTWWDDETSMLYMRGSLVDKVVRALQIPYLQDEYLRGTGRGTDNAEAYDRFIEGLGHLGQHNDVSNNLARLSFEQTIALDDRFAAAYARLAQTLRMQWALNPGMDESVSSPLLERIRSLLARSTSLDSGLAIGYLEKGYIETASGRLDTAATAYEMAALSSPGDLTGLVAQRTLSFVLQNYENALELAQQVVDREPSVYLHYQHLALAQKELRRYSDAIETFTDLIALKPGFSPAYYAIASIHALYLRDYEAAIQWHPDAQIGSGAASDAAQYYDLAEYYLHGNRLQEAMEMFSFDNLADFPFRNMVEHSEFNDFDLMNSFADRMLADRPEYYSGWYTKGILEKRRGNAALAQAYFDSSEQVLTRKIAGNPNSTSATWDHLLLGLSLAESGEYSAAIAHVVQGKLGQRDDARYLSAVIYAKSGQIDAAMQEITAAIALRPYWVDLVRYDLGFERIRSDPRFESLLVQYD